MLSTAAFSCLGDNKLRDKKLTTTHISCRPISIIFLSFIQKISKFLTFFPPRRLSSKQLLFYENMNGCFFLFLHIYISLKSRWNPPNNIFACFMHSLCLFLASNSVIYTIYSIKTPLWILSPFFFYFCSRVWCQCLNSANIHQWHQCDWRQWLYTNFSHLPASAGYAELAGELTSQKWRNIF